MAQPSCRKTCRTLKNEHSDRFHDPKEAVCLPILHTKLALRVVPSGALVPGTRLLIGAGTVVSLRGLIDELDALAKLGIDISRTAESALANALAKAETEMIRLGGDTQPGGRRGSCSMRFLPIPAGERGRHAQEWKRPD